LIDSIAYLEKSGNISNTVNASVDLIRWESGEPELGDDAKVVRSAFEGPEEIGVGVCSN
jgi:hypothetical protein